MPLSAIALARLDSWGIQATDLSDVLTSIAVRFAQVLIGNGLVPEQEFNDACILAETSVAQLPVLVTFDQHLLGIDDAALRLAFESADLPVVAVVHPGRLLRAMR